MSFKKCLRLIQTDLFRYWGVINGYAFFRAMVLVPGFVYTFWFRIASYVGQHAYLKYIFYYPVRLVLLHYTIKFGIDIPAKTMIGQGFYIGHFGGIVISRDAQIGKNCNISHQITIGLSSRGPHAGVPIIGDNVYIGPGAKIIGNIQIGNNVAIGANSVVTKDVPNNAVVAGVPAIIISYQGSEGYILHSDYK